MHMSLPFSGIRPAFFLLLLACLLGLSSCQTWNPADSPSPAGQSEAAGEGNGQEQAKSQGESAESVAHSQQEALAGLLAARATDPASPLPMLSRAERASLGPYAGHYDFLRRDKWGPDIPAQINQLGRSIDTVTELSGGENTKFHDINSINGSLAGSRRNFVQFQSSMQNLMRDMDEKKQSLAPLDGQTASAFEAAYARLVSEPLRSAIAAAQAYRDLAGETDSVVQQFTPAIRDGKVNENFTIHEARKNPDGSYRVRYTLTCPPVRDAGGNAKRLMREARSMFIK